MGVKGEAAAAVAADGHGREFGARLDEALARGQVEGDEGSGA